MPLLQATNLVKRYQTRAVVNDVSVQVDSGEVVGLLGPNGAGKTTCFYMIVGLVGCDGGRIRLDDRDLTRLPMHARARAGLGYLPQEASVFRKLSVRENILAILETRAGLGRRDRERMLEELLHELHIGHLAEQPGISLSGGERRRVEIARALAARPSFMLLDEPFAGIDPLAIADIRQVIRYLSGQGIGVLITDHNVRETLDIIDRVSIISSGSVLFEGTADEAVADAEVRRVYLGEMYA